MVRGRIVRGTESASARTRALLERASARHWETPAPPLHWRVLLSIPQGHEALPADDAVGELLARRRRSTHLRRGWALERRVRRDESPRDRIGLAGDQRATGACGFPAEDPVRGR